MNTLLDRALTVLCTWFYVIQLGLQFPTEKSEVIVMAQVAQHGRPARGRCAETIGEDFTRGRTVLSWNVSSRTGTDMERGPMGFAVNIVGSVHDRGVGMGRTASRNLG